MIEKAEEMFNLGYSIRQISKDLNKSHSTISRWLQKKGYSTQKDDNTIKLKEMANLYSQGFSYEKIGCMFGITRQAVFESLKNFGVVSRTKKILPFIMYDNIKWTLFNQGYYRNTNRGARGNLLLHRYKYQKERGVIPDDWDVHHIDFDKTNNNISNLLALPKDEHTKLHQNIKKEKNENNNV